MEISKEQFGIEITKHLKERKLTQRGLADHLGITSAAVCYLLKNKLRPSAAQFDGIMAYLQMNEEQIKMLRKLWSATQKESSAYTENIEDLFSVRCARNLTVEEVSQRTGIAADRLRFLENKADAHPTAEENRILSFFYGTVPCDQEGLSNEGDPLRHKVAEEFSGELHHGEKSLPVFTPDVLSRAAKAGSLEKFLGGLPFNNAVFNISPLHLKRAKAVLICDAEEIHFGFKGSLELVLADRAPGAHDPLHLGRGSRGGFALWQRMRRAWKYFGAEHPAPRMSNTWSLPVLEIHFVAAPCLPMTSGKKK